MDDKKEKMIDNTADQSGAATPPDGAEKIENEPDPMGLDPTRFGDWEKNGRCIDF